MEKSIFSIISLLLISTSVSARPLNWEAGISGNISLLVGYNHTQSQFNTNNPITDLDTNGNSKNNGFVGAIGKINYTFSDQKKRIYFGSKRSDIALGRFHLEVGYQQQLANKTILSISYIPGLIPQSTWQDPYAITTTRLKTDTNINAINVELNNINHSPFSAQIAYGKYTVDHETSGKDPDFALTINQQKDLNRNANMLFSELSYMQPLYRGLMLRTALNYTHLNTKGRAREQNIYGLSTTLIQNLSTSSLALTLSYKKALFNHTHPIFNKQQYDDTYSAFLAYEYRQIFDWENWGWISLLGYSTTHSNITFYDKNNVLIGTGINYKF